MQHALGRLRFFLPSTVRSDAPTNARPGFPFGFLGAGRRLPKARRGRVFIAQFIIITASVFLLVAERRLRREFIQSAIAVGVALPQPGGSAGECLGGFRT